MAIPLGFGEKKNNKLYQIKYTIGESAKRRDEAILARLRIGHTYITNCMDNFCLRIYKDGSFASAQRLFAGDVLNNAKLYLSSCELFFHYLTFIVLSNVSAIGLHQLLHNWYYVHYMLLLSNVYQTFRPYAVINDYTIDIMSTTCRCCLLVYI